MVNSKDKENELKRNLLNDCLQRVVEKDPNAGFDLAHLFMHELQTKDVQIPIAVIETLISQSAQLGSKDAQEYLQNMWPEMKSAFTRRLLRKGFTLTPQPSTPDSPPSP
jgi:hypothetical protein